MTQVKKFPPSPLLEHFRYDNHESLRVLHRQLSLEDIPSDRAKCDIIVMVITMNLMQHESKLFRFVYGLFSTKRQIAANISFVHSMLAMGQMEPFFSAVLHQMRDGFDTYDVDSAGGWSEPEFNTFLHILSNQGYTYLPPTE